MHLCVCLCLSVGVCARARWVEGRDVCGRLVWCCCTCHMLHSHVRACLHASRAHSHTHACTHTHMHTHTGFDARGRRGRRGKRRSLRVPRANSAAIRHEALSSQASLALHVPSPTAAAAWGSVVRACERGWCFSWRRRGERGDGRNGGLRRGGGSERRRRGGRGR